jgi:hypothetical protein
MFDGEKSTKTLRLSHKTKVLINMEMPSNRPGVSVGV